jgi:hypothetical protein
MYFIIIIFIIILFESNNNRAVYFRLSEIINETIHVHECTIKEKIYKNIMFPYKISMHIHHYYSMNRSNVVAITP